MIFVARTSVKGSAPEQSGVDAGLAAGRARRRVRFVAVAGMLVGGVFWVANALLGWAAAGRMRGKRRATRPLRRSRVTRLLVAALAFAVAPTVAGATVGVRKPAASGCAGRDANVIEQVGGVQVFRSGRQAKLQACIRGHRPRVIHADCQSDITTICKFFPRFLVEGHYLFFGEQINGRGESLFTYVNRIDLREGSSSDAQWFAGGPSEHMISTLVDKSHLTDLVARPDGDAAWIYENAQVIPAVFEVHSEVSAAKSVVVANSPTITPGSLTLAGTTLYWSDSGTPHSARLP